MEGSTFGGGSSDAARSVEALKGVVAALAERLERSEAARVESQRHTDLQFERIMATLAPMASLINQTASRLDDFARVQSVRGRWGTGLGAPGKAGGVIVPGGLSAPSRDDTERSEPVAGSYAMAPHRPHRRRGSSKERARMVAVPEGVMRGSTVQGSLLGAGANAGDGVEDNEDRVQDGGRAAKRERPRRRRGGEFSAVIGEADPRGSGAPLVEALLAAPAATTASTPPNQLRQRGSRQRYEQAMRDFEAAVADSPEQHSMATAAGLATPPLTPGGLRA